MSHSETIELSDDDDIIELQNEFEQLKKEKIKSLNDDQREKQKSNSKRNVSKGVITEIENYNNNTVEMMVEYIKDGHKKEKSFKLNKPKNKDEFNVNNKFVQIVNLFGDRKNDPTSLIYRDIWLKEENNTVKLDIPENSSLRSKYKKKINRKLRNSGIDLTEDIFKKHMKSILFLFISFFCILSIISLTNSYSYENALILNMYGLTFFMFGVFMVFMSGVMTESKHFIKSIVAVTTILTSLSIISYILGISELLYQVSAQGGEVNFGSNPNMISVFNNLLRLMAPYWITSVFYIWFSDSIKYSYNSVENIYDDMKSKLKRKYQKIRGIEHIETN